MTAREKSAKKTFASAPGFDRPSTCRRSSKLKHLVKNASLMSEKLTMCSESLIS